MAKEIIDSSFTNLFAQIPEKIQSLLSKIESHEKIVDAKNLRHEVERENEETGEMEVVNEINHKEFNAYVTLQKLNLEYYAQIERFYAKQIELMKGYNSMHKSDTSTNTTNSKMVLTDEIKEEVAKMQKSK